MCWVRQKKKYKCSKSSKKRNNDLIFLTFFYFLFCRVAESQSRPSYNPSPVVAQHAWMYHCLCLRPCKPSLSVISAALIALGRSCLFAKTNRMESRSSSSFNMRCNSSRAGKRGGVEKDREVIRKYYTCYTDTHNKRRDIQLRHY